MSPWMTLLALAHPKNFSVFSPGHPLRPEYFCALHLDARQCLTHHLLETQGSSSSLISAPEHHW